MPRIKKATDAKGTTFYPASISKAIWDIDRNQRLSVSLNHLYNAASVSYATDTECATSASELN